MSRTEGKADIQVTRPGHIFPFGTCGSSPLPHLTQCCRFSVPERLPLQPFRQDRLSRLPLPPLLMASSCKTVATTGTGVPAVTLHERSNSMSPLQKIHQLEKNIVFIQESHSFMLQGLHAEIDELKQKNRELQFQLVTGIPALPPEPEEKKSEEVSQKLQEKIEKLEKEVKKLRSALKDALKTNATLSNQIELLKRERYASSSSSVASSSKAAKDYSGDSRRMRTPNLPSPEVEEYSDTLRKIQKAAGERNTKSSEGHHYIDRSNHGWGKGGSGYVENRRSYNYHHHRMMQQPHSNGHHQQQPRLPRLPLRNQQQNYVPHHQYQEIQYRQGTGNTLPTLKQSHSEHQSRQRKSRGPQSGKVADQIYNH